MNRRGISLPVYNTEYNREGVLQIWRASAKNICGSLASDQKQQKSK